VSERFFLAALAALCLQGRAEAQGDPCERRDQTACYQAHQQEHLDIFGLPTAQSRHAAGDRVLRVMRHGHWRALVAVEFRRASGREPEVAVFLPRRRLLPAPEPAITATIPLAEWERLTEASRYFHRALVPVPAEPRIDGAIVICTHAGLNIVETVDPSAETRGAQLRQRASDTCDDDLANVYAEQLFEAAGRLIPACAALRLPAGAHQVADCGTLAGDRMAAAVAHNELQAFLYDPRKLSEIFTTEARLDREGRVTDGPTVDSAWSAIVSGDGRGSLILLKVQGEDDQRVRVSGVLQKSVQTAVRTTRSLWAPVELDLVRNPGMGRFEVRHAKVGAFSTTPERCPPWHPIERNC
jgi:hypothetical protein